MKKNKDTAKNYYLKFVDQLKMESRSDQNAFRETLDDFGGEIRKMGEYIKNNEGKDGKKVLANDDGKNDKEALSHKLTDAIITEKPDVKWEDIAGLQKAK